VEQQLPTIPDISIDKYLYIDFYKYFGLTTDDPVFKAAGVFSLSKKRTFNKVQEDIANRIATIFINNTDCIHNYYELSIRVEDTRQYLNSIKENRKIKVGYTQDFDSYRKDFPDFLLPSELLDAALNLVRENKDLFLQLVDGKSQVDEENKYKEELQFTSEHCMVILATAYASNFVLPLCVNYVDALSMPDTDTLLIDLMINIIEILSEGRDINLLNKLMKLIDSRITVTKYSDKVMWNYLPNVGINSSEYIVSQLRKLIVDIIPKLEMDKNVVNYLHVVIKNQLQYLFSSNFPINYKPLATVLEPDEASIFDRNHQDAAITKSEIEESIAKNAIEDLIKRLNAQNPVNANEVNHYINNLKVSKEQQILLNLLYRDELSENYLTFANNIQYVTLLIHMVKYLHFSGYEILSRLVRSNDVPTDMKFQRKIVTKKFISSLENSHLYTDIQAKFSFLQDKFEKSNIFTRLIEGFRKNNRVEISDFEKPLESNLPMDYDERFLGQELLKLIHTHVM
jgi:hypothetical protein